MVVFFLHATVHIFDLLLAVSVKLHRAEALDVSITVVTSYVQGKNSLLDRVELCARHPSFLTILAARVRCAAFLPALVPIAVVVKIVRARCIETAPD